MIALVQLDADRAQIDEHEVVRAGQQIAGPVGCIGPQQRTGAAVPAHATADCAGVTEHLTIADDLRAVAARQRGGREAAAERAGGHDIRGAAGGDVARQLADDERTAQRGRAADDQGIGTRIAAFDLQCACRVLRVTAGDVERADRAGAARAHDTAVGEGLRTECQRAEATDGTGIGRCSAGVAEGRRCEQFDRAGVREGAGHAQRSLADRHKARLNEADVRRDRGRATADLGEGAFVHQRAAAARVQVEVAVAAVEQQAGAAGIAQYPTIVQAHRAAGLEDPAAAARVGMDERAGIQELRVAAGDLQRSADRQRTAAIDGAGGPVIAAADRIGAGTQQRAAAVDQCRCDGCAVGQIQCAAAQREVAGSCHAARGGKCRRGPADVERAARGKLLCAAQHCHAIEAQQSLLDGQHAALVELQTAVVTEVERARAGLRQGAEIVEAAACTGALVEVERVVVVSGFQRQQRTGRVLQQCAIVQQDAATVVVADTAVAGSICVDQLRGVQRDRVGADLGQHTVEGQRACATERAAGPLQVAIDDDRSARRNIQGAAAQQHVCGDRRTIAQRRDAAALLHAAVAAESRSGGQRAVAAVQQQQRIGCDLLGTGKSADGVVRKRAFVDQQSAGLLDDEVAVVAEVERADP